MEQPEYRREDGGSKTEEIQRKNRERNRGNT